MVEYIINNYTVILHVKIKTNWKEVSSHESRTEPWFLGNKEAIVDITCCDAYMEEINYSRVPSKLDNFDWH